VVIDDLKLSEAFPHSDDHLSRVAEVEDVDGRALGEHRCRNAVSDGAIGSLVAELAPGGPGRSEAVGAVSVIENGMGQGSGSYPKISLPVTSIARTARSCAAQTFDPAIDTKLISFL